TIPAVLDPNNNNITGIIFDLTVNAGETFAGGFANIGITLFGHGDPDGIPANGDEQFGLQYQVVGASERNIALAPGTYSIEVPLVGANPMTFATQNFADAFGDGPNQLFQISAFQFFISKSGGFPATVYIDNVRTVEVPEPTSMAVVGIAGGLMLSRRRRSA
ncbi:MAG: PEP-CTERM sorting domain-containing protein, partial [Anaerolineae bacterium]|nr:PEP-CTERM sorting domain-containing protein [Phycisphaerae bacterium]